MHLAFVSYETPFAPCGGIAAVMGRLPLQIEAASRAETVVVTPFHHRIEKTTSLKRSLVGSFGLSYDDRAVMIHVWRHEAQLPFFFIEADDRRFFAGRRHPYDVDPASLTRDSLLFGAAVARGLHVIGPGRRWSLLLQDWECATTALAGAEHPGTHRSYLTLHNSYDCGVTGEQLWRAGINPSSCPGHTVLQRALTVTEKPVFTVSEQFASDLTEDVLQARIVAPQLQGVLKPRLVGIDNGPFIDLAVPIDLLASAQAGQGAGLRDWKAGQRQQFLDALDQLVPDEDHPAWGDPAAFLRDAAPWFVMAGRDDPRQKGYDVAARAAETFLENGDEARFLFFPIPGDEGRPGLGFLERLAQRFPHSVLVLPFIFREGFMHALRGATFGLMPSLYEPFGMANEYYLNGTPAIGRATGGILQQVAPLRGAASYGRAVQTRAARWHAPSVQPTGILFRERDGLPSELADWTALNGGKYALDDSGPDRVHERGRYVLFQSMAEELRLAIQDGARIYQQLPATYDRMLAAGVAHIQQNFAWERAAQDYLRHVAP